MRMQTVFTEAVLRDALASGYELTFSALRGFLLVSADGPTMHVSATLSAVARELAKENDQKLTPSSLAEGQKGEMRWKI